MPTLRTGLVIAGAYADKVRRVLFAQLRDKVKEGALTNQEVARAAGELNRLLFDILVNKLGVDKGDVVRITIDYEVEDGEITWKTDTLQIQAWRRIPDEQVAQAVKESIERSEEIMKGTIEFGTELLGETDTGDLVFSITYGDRKVGALLVTPIDSKAIVRGAVTEPTPLVLKRTTIDVGEDLEESIREGISGIMEAAQNTERREAERVVREIMSLLGEEAEEEEVEEEE
ncbi:MAG: DUF2258 domain-containing protein [Desulfurococcales archaeon]|nr:DUF2258 domain-containing protein [Desulfurococcales archaeon]